MNTFVAMCQGTEFRVTHCSCGLQFALTADFERRRREDQRRFYCPQGRFCRGELELVSRRLEWLHEITEADAIAEGIVRHDDGWWSGGDGLPTGNTARAGYRLLWDHLNGAESWPANPFVWRLEFRPAVFR